MPYLDFQAIKEAHPIEAVAARLGLELKKVGNQLRGMCPSGKGGDRSLVITPDKGVFYSFGLNKGGDVIQLVSLVNGLSPKDAAQWLVRPDQSDRDEHRLQQPEKKQEPVQQADTAPPEHKPSAGFKPLEYLVPDHDAVIALGFDPEFARQTGLGYAPRGVMRGTIAIPVRNSSGILLGYIGVTEAKLPSSWHL